MSLVDRIQVRLPEGKILEALKSQVSVELAKIRPDRPIFNNESDREKLLGCMEKALKVCYPRQRITVKDTTPLPQTLEEKVAAELMEIDPTVVEFDVVLEAPGPVEFIDLSFEVSR